MRLLCCTLKYSKWWYGLSDAKVLQGTAGAQFGLYSFNIVFSVVQIISLSTATLSFNKTYTYINILFYELEESTKYLDHDYKSCYVIYHLLKRGQ